MTGSIFLGNNNGNSLTTGSDNMIVIGNNIDPPNLSTDRIYIGVAQTYFRIPLLPPYASQVLAAAALDQGCLFYNSTLGCVDQVR